MQKELGTKSKLSPGAWWALVFGLIGGCFACLLVTWFYLSEDKELARLSIQYFGWPAAELAYDFLVRAPQNLVMAGLFDFAYVAIAALQWAFFGLILNMLARTVRRRAR